MILSRNNGSYTSTVYDMIIDDVREIYVVREALECMAAKIGVKTISDENLLVLANIVSRMDSTLLSMTYRIDYFLRRSY